MAKVNSFYSGDLSKIESLSEECIYDSFLYKNLTLSRKEKVDRIVPIKGKRESIGAFSLLLHGLLTWGIIDSFDDVKGFKKLGLSLGENGKPYFANATDVHFSLSHSDDRALCVISDTEVGCDIQAFTSRDINKIYNRFFTEEEKKYLDEISDEELRRKEFFKLWSYKESFVKMTGMGIKQPFDEFSVLNTKYGIKVGKKVDNDIYLNFGRTLVLDLDVEPHIAGAICVNDIDCDFKHYFVDLNRYA